MSAYEPPRSRRIAGAAVCAIVESSRSITEAAMTTMKPSQAARREGVRVVVGMGRTLSCIAAIFGPKSGNCGHLWSAICESMRGMVQTSARLLALLSLLQVRREWTGQELA